MSLVTVIARLVDGSVRPFEEFGLDFVDRLRAFQAEGLAGKRLIHALLGDDWGPPPRVVEISWTAKNGQQLSETIPYS